MTSARFLAIGFVMVCFVAFSGTGAVTAQEVSVELSPSEVTAEQGKSFEVDVVVLNPQEEVTGYNFEVEVDNADVASFEGFEVVNEGNQVLGETNVNDGSLNSNGFWDPALESSSEAEIGTLQVETVGAGNADITFVDENTQIFGESGEEYSLRGTAGTSIEIGGEANGTDEESGTEEDESEGSDGDGEGGSDSEDGDRGTEEDNSESNGDSGEEDSDTNEDADESSTEEDGSDGTEETGGGENVDEGDDTDSDSDSDSDSDGVIDSSDDEGQTEEEDESDETEDETENEATENEGEGLRQTNDEEDQSNNNELREDDVSANDEDVEDSEGETNEGPQVAEEDNDAEDTEDREEMPETGDESEDRDETETQEGGESQEGEQLPGFTVALGLVSLIAYGAWRRV